MRQFAKPFVRPIAATTYQFAASLFCLLALPSCAQNEPPQVMGASEYTANFQTAAERLEEYGFTGVIGLAETGKEPIFAGFGESATAHGKPDGSTLVDIGSITKTVTATAAAKLIDDGNLTPADRLGDFFPEAPADKAHITVHQLLTHSSGITDAVGNDLEYLPKDEFIRRAMAAPLMFEPGMDYGYSNVGYSLIAAIIEQRSGKSYESFIRDDLLNELDLTDIGYEAAFSHDRSLLTQNGDDIANGSWGGQSHWALIGNGGLVSSASDMIEFRRAVSSGQLLSNAGVALIQTPLVREGEGAPSHYGYGMVVEDHPYFGRTYWHNGGNSEVSANWTDYADHGVIVFTASNNPNFDADLAGLVIAEALFNRRLIPDDILEARKAAIEN